MKKSEFVMRFWRVVTQIQHKQPMIYKRTWDLAVKYGNEEGLGISPDDSVAENKLLSNLIDVSMVSVVRLPLDVLSVMFLVEQAWEYYQERQVLTPPAHEQ